jgi:hypothetical protein
MKPQTEWMLNELRRGRRMTSLDALREGGISRAAARVIELRDLGYRVETTLIKVQKGNGETARVAEYYLRTDQGTPA